MVLLPRLVARVGERCRQGHGTGAAQAEADGLIIGARLPRSYLSSRPIAVTMNLAPKTPAGHGIGRGMRIITSGNRRRIASESGFGQEPAAFLRSRDGTLSRRHYFIDPRFSAGIYLNAITNKGAARRTPLGRTCDRKGGFDRGGRSDGRGQGGPTAASSNSLEPHPGRGKTRLPQGTFASARRDFPSSGWHRTD